MSASLHTAFHQICDVLALELLSRIQAGKEINLWQEAGQQWHRVSGLIDHIDGLQINLSRKISTSRAEEWAQFGRQNTLTLIDRGKLAFQSQVLSTFCKPFRTTCREKIAFWTLACVAEQRR